MPNQIPYGTNINPQEYNPFNYNPNLPEFENYNNIDYKLNELKQKINILERKVNDIENELKNKTTYDYQTSMHMM